MSSVEPDLSLPKALGVPTWLSTFEPRKPLAVAFSGGADSTALLWACHLKWPGQVHAVHVHHGLQSAADDFVQHCKGFCNLHHIPIEVAYVNAKHRLGQSPEDAARRARYQALEDVLLTKWGGHIKDIALAQHADDQVETVVLALSRGSGLPGLSGMRAQWTHNLVNYHRPILGVPSDQLRAWATEHGLSWIEDPSNSDESFTRNKIRKKILPHLMQTFPNFRQTLSRSAAHMAQAQTLLLELATEDLASVGNPPHIKALQTLTEARRSNLLRHWLQGQGCRSSTAQMLELNRLIVACTTRGHDIQLKVGESCVVRRNAVLELVEYGVLPNHRVK